MITHPYSAKASAVAVHVANSVAFVGNYCGLGIADVSTPAAPQQITWLLLDVYVSALASIGPHLFLGGSWDALSVFDVAESQAPVLLDSVAAPDEYYSQDFAFVSGYFAVPAGSHGARIGHAPGCW